MESNRWHVGREKKYEYVVDVLLIWDVEACAK